MIPLTESTHTATCTIHVFHLSDVLNPRQQLVYLLVHTHDSQTAACLARCEQILPEIWSNETPPPFFKDDMGKLKNTYHLKYIFKQKWLPWWEKKNLNFPDQINFFNILYNLHGQRLRRRSHKWKLCSLNRGLGFSSPPFSPSYLFFFPYPFFSFFFHTFLFLLFPCFFFFFLSPFLLSLNTYILMYIYIYIYIYI